MFPLSEFFKDVDTLVAEKLNDWFADDIVIRFGNGPEIQGRENAVNAIRGFTGGFKKMRHEFVDFVEQEDKIYLDSYVEYTFADDRLVRLPAVTSLRSQAARIKSLKVFIDLSPLYAAEPA